MEIRLVNKLRADWLYGVRIKTHRVSVLVIELMRKFLSSFMVLLIYNIYIYAYN